MDTRTALLDSAENAARRRGIDGFSYADLADDVGIRKASIHYHFPKKHDLALALIQRYARAFLGRLDQIEQTHATAGAVLRAYIEQYRAALKNGEMVCLCVAFSTGRDSLSDAVLGELAAFHEESLTWLSEVFEDAEVDHSISKLTDPKDEAAACLALVEGAQLLARASGQMDLFDQAIAALAGRIDATPEQIGA